MNDLERIKEVETLRKMFRSLKHLPRLLETFDKLKFRLVWLLRNEESVPRWMIPTISPRKVSLTMDILSAIETKISDRGNHSSLKGSSSANET